LDLFTGVSQSDLTVLTGSLRLTGVPF